MSDLTQGWDGNIEPFGDGFFYNSNSISTLLGGSGYFFNMNNEFNHLRAYNECAPLKAIVSKRAKAFNNGVISIVNKTSLKPAQGQTEMLAKLAQPNPLQSQQQFLAQQNTYLDIFGYCPVFITRPVGYDSTITNIWNIPPWLFDLVYTNQWLFQNSVEGIYKSFKMNWQGGQIDLPAKDLTIMFDDGFGTDMDINLTIPDSRLKSLEYDISNYVASNKSTNTLISKKGAIGILSNSNQDLAGHVPLKEGEKQALQKEWGRYGITGQEWQVIISEANLKWQQIGSPIKDLMLAETRNEAIMRLCDAYGYPYMLLSSDKSSSLNGGSNTKEFGIQLYQETIIPESNSRLQQLSKAIFGKDSNVQLAVDYSHVYVLQENKQAAATALKTLGEALDRQFKNNLLTLDEWRAELNRPAIPEFGGKYYYELVELGWAFGSVTSNVVGAQDTPPTTETNPLQIAS